MKLLCGRNHNQQQLSSTLPALGTRHGLAGGAPVQASVPGVAREAWGPGELGPGVAPGRPASAARPQINHPAVHGWSPAAASPLRRTARPEQSGEQYLLGAIEIDMVARLREEAQLKDRTISEQGVEISRLRAHIEQDMYLSETLRSVEASYNKVKANAISLEEERSALAVALAGSERARVEAGAAHAADADRMAAEADAKWNEVVRKRDQLANELEERQAELEHEKSAAASAEASFARQLADLKQKLAQQAANLELSQAQASAAKEELAEATSQTKQTVASLTADVAAARAEVAEQTAAAATARDELASKCDAMDEQAAELASVQQLVRVRRARPSLGDVGSRPSSPVKGLAGEVHELWQAERARASEYVQQAERGLRDAILNASNVVKDAVVDAAAGQGADSDDMSVKARLIARLGALTTAVPASGEAADPKAWVVGSYCAVSIAVANLSLDDGELEAARTAHLEINKLLIELTAAVQTVVGLSVVDSDPNNAKISVNQVATLVDALKQQHQQAIERQSAHTALEVKAKVIDDERTVQLAKNAELNTLLEEQTTAHAAAKAQWEEMKEKAKAKWEEAESRWEATTAEQTAHNEAYEVKLTELNKNLDAAKALASSSASTVEALTKEKAVLAKEKAAMAEMLDQLRGELGLQVAANATGKLLGTNVNVARVF